MKHETLAVLIAIPPLGAAAHHQERMLQRGAKLVWNIVLRSRSVLLALMMISGTTAAAATISVTNTNDSGPGSLRQAIADAVSGDTITFSLPANSIITLTSDELLINKNLTIAGPGANLLTIQRSSAAGIPQFRIFNVTGNIDVTITGLTISKGTTSGTTSSFTGGILNDGATLTITNSTISGNEGGIYNDNNGTTTITNSTISGNPTGGIYNTGSATITITNSTISGNQEGGIYGSSGTITITNSTISGNSQSVGGGILNFNSEITITNSTIAGNSADNGGGIFTINNASGTIRSRNTIIAGNTAPNGPDVFGPLTSDGFNLIGKKDQDATITPTTGDQIGTAASPIDPKLDTLKNNGGPTQTHALLSGSPALDKGHSSGSNTDQRGLARPVDDPSPGFPNASGGDGSDIGAYEVQADQLPGCTAISRVVSNNNDGGAGSLRDVIASVCAGSTITFAQNVRGAITLTSDELMINKSLTISGPGANLLSVQRSTDSGTAEFRIFEIAPANIDVTLSGLTVANGKTSGGSGGGIVNQSGGTLTVMGCAVSGNTASGNGRGGGIFNLGTMTLTNSTISGNSALGGGGIENISIPFRFNSTLTITNSTFSGNSAAGDGAGIENFRVVMPNQPIPVGTVNLTNSTLSGNSAGNSGGGILNPSGNTVNVRNTIIALNTAPTGPDVQGSLTSENFNLIGSSAGATISPAQFSDQVGVTAAQLKLGALQNNGGPTQTRALLSGSFAIDKGHSTGLTTDQRGMHRPVNQPGIANASGGDGGDIGAFEVQAPAPTPTPTPKPTPTATPTATATATPKGTPSPTPKTVLANISTRLKVETGDNTLIGGFIITGTQPKKVIIRAIGPSLTIPGKLDNPTLELRNSSGTLLKANDDWKNSSAADKQAIIDSTIPPSNDLESAIVATLPANNSAYTAIVRGVNNTTGIGVVEIYDLDRSVDSKLANISTRGLVQRGDTVLIAGTIVLGPSSQKVIIRAIGPSLNIPGKLANPILELRNGSGTLLDSNDDWKKSPDKQAIIDSTVPPTNDLESAIVATLPGNGASYTAIVRGVSNTTGIAVVEVYALQ